MASKRLVLDVVRNWASINNLPAEMLSADLLRVLTNDEPVYFLPFREKDLDLIMEAWNDLMITSEDDGFDEYVIGPNSYYVRANLNAVSYYSENKGVGFFVFKKM